MKYTQVLDKLQELSESRAITSFEQRGIPTTDKCLGVGIMKLRKMARTIKRNHERALQLWDSGIYEGKILSILTEEPKKISLEQLERQVHQLYTFELATYFADNIVARTSFLQEKANAWTMPQQPEIVRRAGYACVVRLAKSSRILDDNYFLKHLIIIEFEIERANDWIKEGQNHAHIAIGCRSKTLNEKAIELAYQVGKIEIDYGDSALQAPNALEILKSERVQGKI